MDPDLSSRRMARMLVPCRIRAGQDRWVMRGRGFGCRPRFITHNRWLTPSWLWDPKVCLLSICILRSIIFISWCVNLASLYDRARDCDWKELASMKEYGQLLVVHCRRIIQTLEISVCIHTRHVAQNHRVLRYFQLPLVLSSDQNPSPYPNVQTPPYVLCFCPFRESFINQCFQSQYRCKNFSLPRSTNRSGT